MHWRCHWTTRFELKRRLNGAGLLKFTICQKRFPFKLELSFFPFVLLKVEFLLYLFVHGLCWCVWFIVWKRRRSRINEKLKALQNLIPNSNKVVIFAVCVYIYNFRVDFFLQIYFISKVNDCLVLYLYDNRLTKLQCWMRLSNISSSFNSKYRSVFTFHLDRNMRLGSSEDDVAWTRTLSFLTELYCA